MSLDLHILYFLSHTKLSPSILAKNHYSLWTMKMDSVSLLLMKSIQIILNAIDHIVKF